MRDTGPAGRERDEYAHVLAGAANGMLIVSPAPGRRHQKIIYRLVGQLEQACPEEFDVMVAVRPSQTTELQPDALVALDEDFTEQRAL